MDSQEIEISTMHFRPTGIHPPTLHNYAHHTLFIAIMLIEAISVFSRHDCQWETVGHVLPFPGTSDMSPFTSQP
jgi:hypothetical protein